MTNEHENHLVQILGDLTSTTDEKYRSGQREHQGRLWEKGLLFHLKETRAEAIDLGVYTHCLSRDIQKIQTLAEEGASEMSPDCAAKVCCAEILKVLNGI